MHKIKIFISSVQSEFSDEREMLYEYELKEPYFNIEDAFKTIIWPNGEVNGKVTKQPTGQAAPQVTGEVTGEAGGEVTEEVRRVVLVLNGEMKRADIQKILQLKHDDFFRVNYIIPSLNSGCVEMKYPDNPNHPNQRYRLTTKGKRLKTKLKKEIDKK